MAKVSIELLDQKLDNLIDNFNEFKENYEKGRQEHIREHQNLNKLIFGNDGSNGMKDEILLNTQFRKNVNKFLWIVATALTVEFVGIGFIIFKAIQRIQ